jgi:hypothetical protein
VLLTGCQSPARLDRVIPFSRQDTHADVLILPPQVELSEKAFNADVVSREDWVEAARGRIQVDAAGILSQRKVSVFVLRGDDPRAGVAASVLRRHRGVADALAEQPAFTSNPTFVADMAQFGLGDEAADDLHALGDARYVLLLSLSDSYASMGRVAGQVAVGVALVAAFVLLGMPPPMVGLPGLGDNSQTMARAARSRGATSAPPGRCPEQTGYASMIELATGDIVWFNRVAGGCSDLRDPEDLRQTLELLLTGFP